MDFNNLSNSGETIELEINEVYIVIDPLYVENIRRGITFVNSEDIFVDIRKRIFPYTDTPFAEFIPSESDFKIENIKWVDCQNSVKNENSICSVDSGFLIFINKKFFADFTMVFDWGRLIIDEISYLSSVYWESISNRYPTKSIALVSAPGIDSGYDFVGSGLYRIEN